MLYEVITEYIIEKSGTYYLEVTNENGCSAMSEGLSLIKTDIKEMAIDPYVEEEMDVFEALAVAEGPLREFIRITSYNVCYTKLLRNTL